MVELTEASRWEKHKAGRLIKSNEGCGEHAPWLNMTCWKDIFDGDDMQTFMSWLDHDKQEAALMEIGLSVWRVVLNCSNRVAALRATGSEDILFWLESAEKDKPTSRAFTVTKWATIAKYARQWRNLIYFCWRSFETTGIEKRFESTEQQHRAVDNLKQHFMRDRGAPNPSRQETDRLVLELSLALIHQEGDRLPTTIKYFCGLVGWDRGRRCWKMPSQYTGFLAAMQYVMRVMETADAIGQSHGTLMQMFRERRDKWLVVGLTTPFSMVHRQLQYGLCCAQDAPGSDPIRLPNPGQVIYRGRMFEMVAFKTLIKDVIREAEGVLSKLLFLVTAEIPDIDPYQFSDDQTVHDVGHYFALEHPRFIWDGKVEMFTNLSTNHHDIVDRMVGSQFSQLDAREYTRQVDRFLVLLAVLCMWTCGRTGRGREMLSVIFYNKSSALRNLFLLNGQFMIATGYHKSQSITDREKVCFFMECG